MEEHKVKEKSDHQHKNKRDLAIYLLIGIVAVVLFFSIVQSFQINGMMSSMLTQGTATVGQAVQATAPTMVGGC